MLRKKKSLMCTPATKSGETYQVLTGTGSLVAGTMLGVGLGRAIRPHLPCWEHSLYNKDPNRSGIIIEDVPAPMGPVQEFTAEEASIDDELPDDKPVKASKKGRRAPQGKPKFKDTPYVS